MDPGTGIILSQEGISNRTPSEPITTNVAIYTDGSCPKNPGPGGWAALLVYPLADGRLFEKEITGFELETTNNRMEMMAAIAGLEALKRPCSVCITTDSKLLQLGASLWLNNWKKRGWKLREGGPVKNLDLWQRLDIAISSHKVEWRWVKGHNGHYENERVDNLAQDAAQDASWRIP